MSKIKEYVEKAKIARERFSEWRGEQKRMSKIKAKERHEAYVEQLGRTEAVEKKRAKIRRLQQKYIPKGKGYITPQKGLASPSVFGDFMFSQESVPAPRAKQRSYPKPEPMSMLPSFGFHERPKKKKGKNSGGLFDGLGW